MADQLRGIRGAGHMASWVLEAVFRVQGVPSCTCTRSSAVVVTIALAPMSVLSRCSIFVGGAASFHLCSPSAEDHDVEATVLGALFCGPALEQPLRSVPAGCPATAPYTSSERQTTHAAKEHFISTAGRVPCSSSREHTEQ